MIVCGWYNTMSVRFRVYSIRMENKQHSASESARSCPTRRPGSSGPRDVASACRKGSAKALMSSARAGGLPRRRLILIVVR